MAFTANEARSSSSNHLKVSQLAQILWTYGSMDSKLITSWVTIWGINDLSFSGYQLINRLSLYGPSPQTACHFPILDESIFQGARCSSAVAENLRPNVPGSEFQASGGGRSQYWKAGWKKRTWAVQKSWTEGSKRSIFMQISGFFIGFLTCGGLSTQLCSTNFVVTNGFTF